MSRTQIIPTIASYTNNPFGYPFWSEFNPVPMNHGIRKQELIEHYSNTFGDKEISILNEYLYKVGATNSETYKIDEETTDWKNFKKVKIGDLDKMERPDKYDQTT